MNRSLPLVCAALAAAPFAHAQDWTEYACDSRRLSTAGGPVPPLTARWTVAEHNGHALIFPNPGGVVAAAGSVYAVGKLNSADVLIAVNAANGEVRWAAPVPAPTFDSNSTPAIDTENQTVLIAASQSVRAFRTADGTLAWTAPLLTDVVGASPCITRDRGPADRLLITDFDFTGAGRLYCINIDPFNAATNPHQPGDMVWSVAIGSTSGNTPAYDAGRVYVSCAELAPGAPGGVMCFALTDTPPTSTIWTTPCPAGQSYFSGVCVSRTSVGGQVYAASYGFVGGQLAGDLAALDADTGAVLWHSPSNRTDSTPIPLADGRVLLSGGLEGFGSVPSLELFSASGSMLWDTALATWNDDNANMQIDPGEYVRLGGWVHQPAVIVGASGPIAVAGDPGSTLPDRLHTLALDLPPTNAGFVTNSYSGAGGTPAIATIQGVSLVFTTGPAGLVALGSDLCYANCDASSTPPVLNVLDFSCFLNRFAAGDTYANCDQSSAPPILNVLDFGCFLNRFAAGCP